MTDVQALATYTNVLLHHVPNAYAPSTLFSILVGAMAWGVMASELAYNNAFDRRLLCSPGWLHPHRAATRASYYLMRVMAILNLSLALIYTNVPGLKCVPFYASLRATWYTAVVCVDFIFYSRTMALYGWKKKLWIPVTVATLTYVSIGAYNTALWGMPFQIPQSDFCGYVTSDIRQPSKLQRLFLFQYFLALATDTFILVLTCLRLWNTTENDKAGAKWKTQSGQPVSNLSTKRSISRTLVVQGFILYGSLELAHLALVLVYFTADYRQSWSSATYTLIILLKVITASNLVRLTSDAVRKTRMDPTSQSIGYRSARSATTTTNSKTGSPNDDEKVSSDIERQAGAGSERAKDPCRPQRVPTMEVVTVQHIHTLTFDEIQERNRLASAAYDSEL